MMTVEEIVCNWIGDLDDPIAKFYEQINKVFKIPVENIKIYEDNIGLVIETTDGEKVVIGKKKIACWRVLSQYANKLKDQSTIQRIEMDLMEIFPDEKIFVSQGGFKNEDEKYDEIFYSCGDVRVTIGDQLIFVDPKSLFPFGIPPKKIRSNKLQPYEILTLPSHI